jgi:hypothetical protein
VRLTPIAAAISCSVGNFAPGANLAPAMCAAIRSAISRLKFRGGATGCRTRPESLCFGTVWGSTIYQVII